MATHRPDDTAFTIGWICALPIELAAAIVSLDIEYKEGAPGRYTFGSIAGHNVVVACLPRMGTNDAATVAASMKAAFANLEHFFMVGIGGGVEVPGRDMRLGDVVVSKPTGQYGGVVQYDMGKTRPNGVCERTGHLNSPPTILLEAMNKFIADEQLGRCAFVKTMASILQAPIFTRPPADTDMLFVAEYCHAGSADESCKKCCNADFLVVRESRSNIEPKVHYGTIASGNQVMRDGVQRDRISSQFGAVLCFEMEAAGLMNSVSALVVRGICDYADSHKNKAWQPYAAATAAAWTKQFLSMLPSVMQDLRIECLESLKFDRMNARQQIIKIGYGTTCAWILQTAEFREWSTVTGSSRLKLLWLKGNPGTGKSTVMKFLLEELIATKGSAIVISFFFNRRGQELEKNSQGLFRSFLHQLLAACPNLHHLLDPSIMQGAGKSFVWTAAESSHLMGKVLNQLGARPLICLIDALDECEPDETQDLVDWFQDMLEDGRRSGLEIKVILASRYYPLISLQCDVEMALEKQAGHSQDITQYTQAKLRLSDQAIQENIRAQVIRQSKGNFLWIVLIIAAIRKEDNKGRLHAIQETISQLPKDLNDLFFAILTQDDGNVDEMRLCLQWVLLAERPMTPRQLYAAVLWTPCSESLALYKVSSDQVMTRFILNSSRGLAEVASPTEAASDQKQPLAVQFIHESVREYLLSNPGIWWSCPQLTIGSFRGLAQDQLKGICLKAIVTIAEALRSEHTVDGVTQRPCINPSSPAASFATYATRSILYHAEMAQRAGVAQKLFVQEFPTAAYRVMASHCLPNSITPNPFYLACEQQFNSLVDIALEFRQHGIVVLDADQDPFIHQRGRSGAFDVKIPFDFAGLGDTDRKGQQQDLSANYFDASTSAYDNQDPHLSLGKGPVSVRAQASKSARLTRASLRRTPKPGVKQDSAMSSRPVLSRGSVYQDCPTASETPSKEHKWTETWRSLWPGWRSQP